MKNLKGKILGALCMAPIIIMAGALLIAVLIGLVLAIIDNPLVLGYAAGVIIVSVGLIFLAGYGGDLWNGRVKKGGKNDL